MVLTALGDQNGADVDWWFIYKLPHTAETLAGGQQAATGGGYDYLYYDPSTADEAGLKLSTSQLNADETALARTLAQLMAPGSSGQMSPSFIWYLYNDEIPGTGHNDEDKGHTKGVVAYDPASATGFWLSHSTPRFPAAGRVALPADERVYGQTYLCLSFAGDTALNAIAGQMRRLQTPQIYDFNMPAGALPASDEVSLLCRGVEPDPGAGSGQITITSRAGKNFTSVAKDRRWGKDFWTDLVGPTLGVDLNVESWRRGAVPSDADSQAGLDVADVSGIDLAPLGVELAWPYTHDHAKWAVSTSNDWVCVADLNRQVSQEKRGGGALCFKEPRLWQDLSAIDKPAEAKS